MRLRDPALKRDRALLVVGAVLLGVGVAIAIDGYALSHAATNDQRQQLDAITIGLIGVAVTVVGAALFLRYSIAQFLRFWLARSVYEQKAQTDRVVEALGVKSPKD
jgi:TRAP-type C4-dicarboxylate transport system permease small subunit